MLALTSAGRLEGLGAEARQIKGKKVYTFLSLKKCKPTLKKEWVLL